MSTIINYNLNNERFQEINFEEINFEEIFKEQSVQDQTTQEIIFTDDYFEGINFHIFEESDSEDFELEIEKSIKDILQTNSLLEDQMETGFIDQRFGFQNEIELINKTLERYGFSTLQRIEETHETYNSLVCFNYETNEIFLEEISDAYYCKSKEGEGFIFKKKKSTSFPLFSRKIIEMVENPFSELSR